MADMPSCTICEHCDFPSLKCNFHKNGIPQHILFEEEGSIDTICRHFKRYQINDDDSLLVVEKGR